MGIKGIYKELGQGRRISLSKLAADSLRCNDRPYRVAVDIAIWQFQTQAARGGTNPAIRTLFYRLVRLLSIPIQPIFVFDGPHKPALKRNKRSGRGDGVATALAKRLIRLFGFPVHDAPGEAEAECALLQKHGLVDAVLSEDVDTIMFGCTRTLRNWSSEGKTSKTPTHVSLYDVQEMALDQLGLDREGMVLVALMSGGDYLPDGIPGCGVKVACEAAKAGFGRSVCRLKTSDEEGIKRWREGLIHELRTNEKGHFKSKHKALTIPKGFPNLEVLRYYTHPVVSPESVIDAIRQRVEQKYQLHLEELREFARETFDWDYRGGAVKFVRVMGPALLVKNMTSQHVKRISGRRTHFSTDGTPELRVSFVPEEMVPIDLSKEVDETIAGGRSGLALNSDDDFDDAAEVASATNMPKLYDVTKSDLAWILQSWIEKSAPDAFQEWQKLETIKLIRQSPKKPRAIHPKKATDATLGSLDKFFRTTKASRVSAHSQDIPKRAGSVTALSSSPVRSQALSTSPSKQARSSPSPKKVPAIQTIDSSPIRPRIPKAEESEAIYISSSPPAFSSPLQPSASAPSTSTYADVPEPLRSLYQTDSTDMRAPTQESSLKRHGLGNGNTKQSSMELFVTKHSRKALNTHRDPDEHSDSDLAPLSALAVPKLQSKRATRKIQQRPVCNVGDNASLGNRPVEVWRRAVADVHQESEPRVQDGRAESSSSNGRERQSVRWSDVSVIDLTESGD